ncbi:MAG TPA: sulfatase [Planctomycetota bacterium]|nr:sulfatase [Planctomycetota bacterium]
MSRPATPAVLIARLIAGALLAAALLVPPGCGAKGASRTNVVLIVLDTLRTDHMSAYGYRWPTTPNLDALAARGARFADCTSQAAWTGPSMISLMTGLPIFNTLMHVPAEFPVLAEPFQRAGWRTGAAVANSVLSDEHGFARGFDDFSARAVATEQWTAADVNRHALEFLDKDDGRPFFLWLHYLDTHHPYTPPDRPWKRSPKEVFTPWELETIDAIIKAAPDGDRARLYTQIDELADEVDRYDAELHWLDGQLGELFADLERRGLLDQTIVVVAADHGETLFRRPEHPDHLANTRQWKEEHGVALELADYVKREHHSYTYQELIHVPLIVAGPGIPAGQTIESLVSNLDVRPTLIGLAGLPVPETRGRDLSPALRAGGPVAPDAWVTSCAYDTVSARLPDGRKCVVPAEKLVRREGAQPLLYSLPDDPDERRPQTLDLQTDAIVKKLYGEWGDDPFSEWLGSESTPKDIETLRELGYVR